MTDRLIVLRHGEVVERGETPVCPRYPEPSVHNPARRLDPQPAGRATRRSSRHRRTELRSGARQQRWPSRLVALDHLLPRRGRRPGHAGPHGPNTAGQFLLTQLVVFEVPPCAGDEQMVEVGTTKATTGRVADGHLHHRVEASVRRVTAHTTSAPKRHPQVPFVVRAHAVGQSVSPFYSDQRPGLANPTSGQIERVGPYFFANCVDEIHRAVVQPRPLDTPIPSSTRLIFGPVSRR
jgi:hypothetical protein